MKMEEPKFLTNEILFNIGEAYMVINLLQGDADDDQNAPMEVDANNMTAARLKIKIFDKTLQGES